MGPSVVALETEALAETVLQGRLQRMIVADTAGALQIDRRHIRELRVIDAPRPDRARSRQGEVYVISIALLSDEVADIADAPHPCGGELPLDRQIELLDIGVRQVRVYGKQASRRIVGVGYDRRRQA